MGDTSAPLDARHALGFWVLTKDIGPPSRTTTRAGAHLAEVRSRITNETEGSIACAHTPLAPRPAVYDASVTVLPCAHADFIALGVCQDPECPRMVIADEPTAGR